MHLSSRVLTGLIAAAVVAAPSATFAQTAPSDPTAPPPQTAPPAMPSYAAPAPSYSSTDEVIKGRISSFDGAYSLAVHDDRGFIDNVKLRQGTVINPTGIRLAAGMSVTIHGVNRGSAFEANQIDTPYSSFAAVPVYGPVPIYGSIYPYGYPAYPYPVYGYPYGRVSIGIGFGGWGGYGWGGYGWGGYRGYGRFR
jgi:hypothetical protein